MDSWCGSVGWVYGGGSAGWVCGSGPVLVRFVYVCVIDGLDWWF